MTQRSIRYRRGTYLAVVAAVLVGVALMSTPAGASDQFDDVSTGSTFHDDIGWLADTGITRGCNPPSNTRFCPDDPVTRGQMAAFLNRALDLPAGSGSFADTGGSTFEADIAALADAGITRGCNPPSNTRFCPDDPVTRGQMAAFLHRGLEDEVEVVTYLSSLDEVDTSVFFLNTGAAQIDGDTYEQSVHWRMLESNDPEWVEYDISREYGSFCVVAGVADDADASTAFQLEVFGDGVSLGTHPVALGQPAQISVPVDGVLRLRIESRPGTTEDFDGHVAWGNAYLSTQSDCEPPNPNPSSTPLPQTFLSNLDDVDTSVFFLNTGTVDVNGGVYTRSVYWRMLENNDPEWVEYDMSRDFGRLCGLVGVTDDSDAATAFDVEVYVDGSSVFVADVSLGSTANIDVPVSSGLRLRIEARPGTTSDFDGDVAWADTYLATATSCS